MQKQLNIAVIQSDLIWEDPNKNRLRFTDKIKKITQSIDLIILPEMFTSGFTMSPKNVAETMQGETIKWMQEIAIRSNAALAGSIVVEEKGAYYNRFLFVKPNGSLEFYDKRHTFTLAGEDKVYKSGKQKVILELKGWKICPQVCYDLRFPVWSRNVEDYDVLIYVANWPKPRILAWDALLKARSIENMCYCVGVNRVGFDDNNYEYIGHSAVYDALGEEITSFEESKEQIEIISLNKDHLSTMRNKLKFLNDRDSFNLVI